MSDNCTCFQSKKELFQEYALIEMAKSPEYASIEQQLESILLLADRILAALQESLEFGRIWDIAQYLENISANIKDRDALNKSTEELLQAMERWFKPIVSLALPAIWVAKKNDGKYTLNPVIDDLDILDGNELSRDVDQIHTITNPARSLLLIAYRYRNPLVHNPKDFPGYVKARFLPAGLTSLLAPVYKYQKEIRQRLDSLITASFESQETINLISMIGNERQRHLANFRGRQKWVSELKSRLESISSKPQPYLLLVGHEGMGKSALSAQITEAFSSINMMGRHTGNVRKVAPWLPNTIIHFGKQSNQPQEIVHLLVAQINTLLLAPVKLSSPSKYKQITNVDYRAPGSSSQYMRNQKLGESHYGTYVAEVAHQDKYMVFQTEGTNLTQLRRDLYLALETAVRERGKVVLIIDAIDEISADGSGLEFLPDTLPVGVSALLTARPDIRVVTWLQNNRDVSKIRLTELERNEIPLFTGLQDDLGETEAKFNDRLWRASKGWPLFVIEASKLIQEHPGRLDAIQVDKSMDNLFERQAKEWKSAPDQDGISTLSDLLSLLAIFEPVFSLDMDLVQSFLERHNKQYSREKIKELLQIVSSQVEGMDTNRIKLALKSFAEYLRNRWYSRRDLQRALSEITEWLSKEQDIDAKFIALFLYFWTDTKRPREQREIAYSLVESIVATKNGILLHQIYRALMEQDNSYFNSDSVAYRCLIAAAELEHTQAMLNLGTRLLDGNGLKKDSALGINWIQRAAEMGEADAMLSLGWRLLDGKGVEKDTESGDKWLLRAIECGDDDAKHIYANRLLDGVGIEVNADKGERLLLELADSGNQKATLNLATRYLIGDELVQDIERGENLLRSLAAQEYLPARLSLADMLISGASIVPNLKEGVEILQNLSDQGNKEAAISLSYRLMFGLGLTQDISKAHQILINLATSGDMDAMVILGDLLLKGDVLPTNVEEGKKWLVKAADENHHRAMVNLGLRFLDADGLPRNVHEGKRWLSRASELGDARAMRILGERLFDGDLLQKNVNAGLEWLKKAADAGDEWAMILLSQKLLDGDKVTQDIQEGEYLLRKACDADHLEAWRILGNRLLAGEGLQQNLPEGERYLRKAANAQYPPAMCDLGMRLFTGNNLSENISEAKQWLDKACKEAEITAMQFVAQKLIEGDGYDVDIVHGEKLLRDSISKGDSQSKQMLGRYLIYGDKLPKNTAEGLRLLDESCQDGNTEAMYHYAEMLFKGEHIPINLHEARKWLRKAAQEGDADAMSELGRRYLDGDGLDKNLEEGKKWLQRGFDAGDPNSLAMLGKFYYQVKSYYNASKTLLEGYKAGSLNAGNNLAFMLRRGEVKDGDSFPSVASLLQPLLEKADHFAHINHALAIAAGFEFPVDWQQSDRIFHDFHLSEDSVEQIMEWWYKELAQHNDPEGHLVTGWLVRHNITTDPNGMTIKQRMDLARQGGWDIPAWMDSAASPTESFA